MSCCCFRTNSRRVVVEEAAAKGLKLQFQFVDLLLVPTRFLLHPQLRHVDVFLRLPHRRVQRLDHVLRCLQLHFRFMLRLLRCIALGDGFACSRLLRGGRLARQLRLRFS
jgi:hypothetical protein